MKRKEIVRIVVTAIVTMVITVLSALGLYSCSAAFQLSKGSSGAQSVEQHSRASVDSTSVNINNKK